jgi:P27 family predicted phage terminase small subunit
MAKGRKAIPTNIINLRGGSAITHRPPRDAEPRPPEKMPRCPSHLDDFARREWRRAAKILGPIGLLTEIDMMIFAAYCEAYSRWVYANTKAAETGMVYVEGAKKDPSTGKMVGGIPRLNPYLRIAREAYDQMIKAGMQIGMSPVSRATLKVEKPAQADPREAFLNG